MKPELESICDLVRACGLFIKDIDRDHLHVDAKSGRADLVTQYDKQVQEYNLARNKDEFEENYYFKYV